MSSIIRLVDSNWTAEVQAALETQGTELLVVCPFIKSKVAGQLLKTGGKRSIRLLTRFNLVDFSKGVSDVAALDLLLREGAEIRGIRNLHAKLYVFGDQRAMVTSANLTERGLSTNHELGVVSDAPEVILECRQYFERLWDRSGPNLDLARIDQWKTKLQVHLATNGGRTNDSGDLGDEGTDLNLPVEPSVETNWIRSADEAYVKFFGTSGDRLKRSESTFKLVKDSGCHWACTYPKNKRPRSVIDGATMFMGRFVRDPDDILVYGRATGMKYQEGRDDASLADIALREWKTIWPRYIRVHNPEFLQGNLGNGVSLNELMELFGLDSFESTQRNNKMKSGNVVPRRAYMQRADVKLSAEATSWLNDCLDGAFQRHGKIGTSLIAALDQPLDVRT